MAPSLSIASSVPSPCDFLLHPGHGGRSLAVPQAHSLCHASREAEKLLLTSCRDAFFSSSPRRSPSRVLPRAALSTTTPAEDAAQVSGRTDRRSGDADTASPGKEGPPAELFACPICQQPLSRSGPFSGITQQAVMASGWQCRQCRRAFSTREGYLDLTVLAGAREYVEAGTPGTETFRNPLVSYVYERGWRQSFARAGFPGPDEEFRLAQDLLRPAARGGVLLDVSCGSGLFSRRFAASRVYSAVIASDFSETMLRQAAEFVGAEPSLDDAALALVRADVARLPFPSGSLDGVHAGAALHCWPSPTLAVAEISRVLKPGGAFVATTFLAPRAPFFEEYLKPLRKAVASSQRLPGAIIRYWEPEELEELCRMCGLTEYTAERRRDFIILAARKPS